MSDKRTKGFLKNTLVLALGTIFPKIAVFITLPILTSHLTKAEFGTYDLVLTLVAMVLPITTVQIHSAAFRFLIECRDDDRRKTSIISNIYAFLLPVSIVSLMVFFFVFTKVDSLLRLVICIYFLFDTLTIASRYVIRGLGNNHLFSISTFISAAGQVGFICLFVLGLHLRLLGVVMAMASAEAISFLFLLFSGRLYRYMDRSVLDWSVIRQLLGYSWPMVPNNFSSWAMRASNRLVIAAILGLAMNGVFSVAFKIPGILMLVNATFNMSWQETASMTSGDEDVSRYYSGIFDKIYRLAVGMLGLLIAVTPVLFKLLVRGDYDEAYPQVIILNVAMFFCVISSFWGGIYVAFKKTGRLGLSVILATVLNILITLIFIKWLGLYAASLAMLVSYLFLCIYRILDCRKTITIRYDFKLMLLSLVFIAVQCYICSFRRVDLDVLNGVLGLAIFAWLNRKTLATVTRNLLGRLKPARNRG